MARLGLSVDEMLSVQNTWKLVMENVGHTAENMVLMYAKIVKQFSCFFFN